MKHLQLIITIIENKLSFDRYKKTYQISRFLDIFGKLE